MIKYHIMLEFEDANGNVRFQDVWIVEPDQHKAYQACLTLAYEICANKGWELVCANVVEKIDTRN